MPAPTYVEPERAATGVEGLDDILLGGLPRNRMYLVQGDPGCGKTTLALQFILEGIRCGEPGLYVVLSESAEELRSVAASHGWDLTNVSVCDLASSQEHLNVESQYTLFHPSEVELSDTTQVVLEAVEKTQPMRVVFDSLSEMRLLARDSLRYRRQILALKQFFTARQCTVVLLDYGETKSGEFQLKSLAHGVVELDMVVPSYGGQRRRLKVQKMRGSQFRDGYHDMTIATGGIKVFPRLIAAEHRHEVSHELVPSGVPELDALMDGGLHRGTSTLILGPAGVGKSTLACQYVAAALARGERCAAYIFDEVPDTLTMRAGGLGMSLDEFLASEQLTIRQVDPAELSAGEFAASVRDAVERGGARVVVIDSMNGYRNSIMEERYLSSHLHELLAYLNQQGVATFLVVSQTGILGEGVESPVELTYLADNVILLRYFEALGEVRQAISVVKKRSGNHERTIRELRMGPSGIRIGRELREFQGILTGHLVYTGGSGPLLRDEDVNRLVDQ